MARMPARRGERLTFATLLGLVVLLAVVPIARLAQEALAPHGAFDPAVVAGIVESPVVWRAARNTVSVSLGGATLAVIGGAAFALLGLAAGLAPRRIAMRPVRALPSRASMVNWKRVMRRQR
jgi:ABC-type Fe3+ transport system permease subunit